MLSRIARAPSATRGMDERGRRQRRHDALGQELAHDPAAAGAQGQAQRQLALPLGAAREDEVRDVDAGDQQHEHGGGLPDRQDSRQHRVAEAEVERRRRRRRAPVLVCGCSFSSRRATTASSARAWAERALRRPGGPGPSGNAGRAGPRRRRAAPAGPRPARRRGTGTAGGAMPTTSYGSLFRVTVAADHRLRRRSCAARAHR